MPRIAFAQVASVAMAAALVLATWLPTIATPATPAAMLFAQHA